MDEKILELPNKKNKSKKGVKIERQKLKFETIKSRILSHVKSGQFYDAFVLSKFLLPLCQSYKRPFDLFVLLFDIGYKLNTDGNKHGSDFCSLYLEALFDLTLRETPNSHSLSLPKPEDSCDGQLSENDYNQVIKLFGSFPPKYQKEKMAFIEKAIGFKQSFPPLDYRWFNDLRQVAAEKYAAQGNFDKANDHHLILGGFESHASMVNEWINAEDQKDQKDLEESGISEGSKKKLKEMAKNVVFGKVVLMYLIFRDGKDADVFVSIFISFDPKLSQNVLDLVFEILESIESKDKIKLTENLEKMKKITFNNEVIKYLTKKVTEKYLSNSN